MAMKFQKAVREKLWVKILLSGPSGAGKALTLDSDLMTPNGPIKMGNGCISPRKEALLPCDL